jgi:hypothetical protein
MRRGTGTKRLPARARTVSKERAGVLMVSVATLCSGVIQMQQWCHSVVTVVLQLCYSEEGEGRSGDSVSGDTV